MNGKSYTLRETPYFYYFSRGNSDEIVVQRRARSLTDLVNYIEYQNRLIAIAPNGRYYAIRKHDALFKINRDNGSVLTTNFTSVNEAKQMLDTCAVNGPVPYQYHKMCGFDTYGKE